MVGTSRASKHEKSGYKFMQQQSQGELLAKLAANLMCEAEATSAQSSCVVLLGIGMPALQKKLERIKAGDYVDFTEMPPAKGKNGPLLSVLKGNWC